MARAMLVGLALGVLTLVLAAANFARDPDRVAVDWRLMNEPTPEVEVVRPTRRAIVQRITASGVIEPIDQVDVVPQGTGRVVAVLIAEGDPVQRGQLLARLDDAEVLAQLDALAEQLRRIQEMQRAWDRELFNARREVQRLDAEQVRRPERSESNASDRFPRISVNAVRDDVARADLQARIAQAERALKTSQSQYQEAEALYRAAQRRWDATEIRSPLTGQITALDLRVDQVVGPSLALGGGEASSSAMDPARMGMGGMGGPGGLDALMSTNLMGDSPRQGVATVTETRRLRVRAWVDEADVPLVAPGQSAEIYLPSDPLRAVLGRVERIALIGRPQGDVTAFATRILIDNPSVDSSSLSAGSETLRIGMTATVEIAVRRVDDALVIPVEAVIQRPLEELGLPRSPGLIGDLGATSKAEERVVFVLDGTRASVRFVRLGLSDPGVVEILDGLEAEDRVIVGPFRVLDQLRDGQYAQASTALPTTESKDPLADRGLLNNVRPRSR